MQPGASSPQGDRLLFAGCFLALIATAFGFIVRAMLINTWGVEFALTETQKGEIFGVGLWPFAISIILFSLVIDRIGYGKAMVFAFLCHVVSAWLTITAKSYDDLWLGTFSVALGNGTVEAVVNPAVATMFRQEKTKWLNILHAGWPGGLVLGGLLALSLGEADWRWKVGLLMVPTLLYGVILLRCRFPVQERVAAGVSDREMFAEIGGLGMFIVLALVFLELGRVFQWSGIVTMGAAAVISLAFGIHSRSAGRPMFAFLLLVMVVLATTELGVDSWITPLMEGEFKPLGINPVWVLIYTSLLMMVLRLFAGPIVHSMSPVGLLCVSSLLAALGLWSLAGATGAMILLAATLYGVGKSFFWPTMLGIVAERFPRGGALTLNAMGGAGMLGVGVVGAVLLGYIQDTEAVHQLQAKDPAVYQQVVSEKQWVLGSYQAIDPDKVKLIAEEPKRAEITAVQDGSKKSALSTAASFPVIMLVSFLGLALWFRSKGGYKAEKLGSH